MAKQETSLAPAQPAGLTESAVPRFIEKSDAGRETISSADMKIPFLALAQPLSDVVGAGLVTVGNFYNNVNKESYGTTMDVIVLASRRGAKLNESYNKGNKLLCSSNDGITGQGEPGGSCFNCKRNVWYVNAEGKSVKDCSEEGRMLIFFPGTKAPMAMTLRRTSFKTWKAINSLLAEGDAPTFAKVLRFTSKPSKSNAQNKAIDVSVVGWVTEADYKMAKHLHEICVPAWSQSTSHDAEPTDPTDATE